MDGDGISVEFDGSCLHVRPTNVIERGRLGTDHLVVPAAEIALLTIKGPGLTADGRLDVSTRGGQCHQLHFTRKQRSDFEALHRELRESVDRAHIPVPPETAPPDDREVPRAMPNEHPPTEPMGTPWQLHRAGYFRQSVVGESYHTDELDRIAGPEPGGEKWFVAELRREPRNPHDRDAIQVLIGGGLVGYLPREEAPAYQPELKALEDWGHVAQCPAQLWWRREQHELVASVSLDLAEPGRLVPIVRHPPDALVLPAGRWFRVSGEAGHMDVLVPLLNRAYVPGKAFAYAQLDLVDRAGPRSVTSIAVVLIDGGVVGELSKQTSARLRGLLEPLREVQVACYVEAELTGNTLAAAVRVSLTMPEELPPDFVQRVEAAVGRL